VFWRLLELEDQILCICSTSLAQNDLENLIAYLKNFRASHNSFAVTKRYDLVCGTLIELLNPIEGDERTLDQLADFMNTVDVANDNEMRATEPFLELCCFLACKAVCLISILKCL
jgi:hypothetical protein